MKKMLIALGMISAMLATSAYSQEAEDYIREKIYLGSVSLLDYTGKGEGHGDVDRDVEDLVGKHCGFERIQFQAQNKAALLKGAKVVFGNGDTQQLPVDGVVLRKGESTRSFNLENRDNGDNDRCIDRIVIKGETLSVINSNDREDQSKIRVYGIK